MGFNALSCRCKKVTSLALSAVISLVLLGCGGGGAGDEEFVVAPESLDEVTMNFFNTFNLTFYRGSGTRGDETGAVSYEPIRTTFLYGRAGSASTGVATPIEIPVLLTNVSYTYTRTSATTGRIVMNYTNVQEYPHDSATASNTEIEDLGTMFWDSPTSGTTTFDLVFTNDGGFLGDRVARVRSLQYFYSEWNTTTNSAVDQYVSEAFDTPNVVSSRLSGGGRVPVGYDPYDEFDNENKPRPSKMVWESLNERTVLLSGTDELTVAFVATGSAYGIEEVGSILIDTTNGVRGGSGTYEWNREGGTLATLKLTYQDYVNGTLQTVEREYKFTFTSLDDGTFTSNEAGSGLFSKPAYSPL